ncbi:MAG: succinyl-diaminopimelate desuccinylase, partial [Burkholderiaceae bacterium]
MTQPAIDQLLQRLDGKRDELVALTQALIQVPTINPPGDAYEACARLMGERLRARGFAVEYVRAVGAPGDSAAYPRVNVVARREGRAGGPCVHVN